LWSVGACKLCALGGISYSTVWLCLCPSCLAWHPCYLPYMLTSAVRHAYHHHWPAMQPASQPRRFLPASWRSLTAWWMYCCGTMGPPLTWQVSMLPPFCLGWDTLGCWSSNCCGVPLLLTWQVSALLPPAEGGAAESGVVEHDLRGAYIDLGRPKNSVPWSPMLVCGLSYSMPPPQLLTPSEQRTASPPSRECWHCAVASRFMGVRRCAAHGGCSTQGVCAVSEVGACRWEV